MTMCDEGKYSDRSLSSSVNRMSTPVWRGLGISAVPWSLCMLSVCTVRMIRFSVFPHVFVCFHLIMYDFVSSRLLLVPSTLHARN